MGLLLEYAAKTMTIAGRCPTILYATSGPFDHCTV